MAKDLKAFLTRMKEDSAFAEEVKAKSKSIAEAEKISDEREILVKVGREFGYEFTVDDLKINIHEDREMSDAELEKVAGGYSWAEFLDDLEEYMYEMISVYNEVP